MLAAGVLDGKTYGGEIGKTGEKGDSDELVFRHGTFVSTACTAFGFKAAPYVAKEEKGVVTFSAVAKNPKGETMSWKGSVKNGKIEATVVYKTKGAWFRKARQTGYWYKGALKPAPAPSKARGSSGKHEHPEHPEHPK